METNSRKKELRREALIRRNGLTEKERTEAAVCLAERLLGHQWYYCSENIIGFVPYGSEIDISEILQDALEKRKKLYLPKIIGQEMYFFRVTSLTELEEGYKGIMEPIGNTEEYVYSESIASKTLMIMPGVAFDPMRNRIGYGKGYYDRYLQEKTGLQLRSIAVGYRCQMLEEIPAQETDIKPYQVICV